MTIARLLTACAVAGGAVLSAATPAGADVAVAVVLVVPGGACPAGTVEVARSDQATLCYHVEDPDWKLLVDGSPCDTGGDPGWTEYSVLDTARLCVRP